MTCEFHDASAVCDRCPDGFDTDGKGFPHRGECKGRQALRVCRCCAQATPLERWDTAQWFYCLECTRTKTPAELAQGKFSAVPRETADLRIGIELVDVDAEIAQGEFSADLRIGIELVDVDAEIAQARAAHRMKGAIFEAALVVGRHWNDQDGVNAQHVDALAELVRRYDESRKS